MLLVSAPRNMLCINIGEPAMKMRVRKWGNMAVREVQARILVLIQQA